MNIHDLEFISSCEQEHLQNDLLVSGGAAAYAKTSTSTDKHSIYAYAESAAAGDYTSANTVTGAKVLSNDFYKAGYGVAYGVAVGAEGYSYKTAYDTSVVTL
ncbi:MAG: hypothetical protein AAF383_05765 [Cyanobacteria bacterium P01_A01_bin.83]